METTMNVQEKTVAYLHGRFEAQIEAFASSIGVPTSELAARVGALLCGIPYPSGSTHPVSYTVPNVQYNATRIPKRKRKSLEMDEHTPTHVRQNKGIKAYWARMTPDQRKAEMQRRIKIRGPSKRKRKS